MKTLKKQIIGIRGIMLFILCSILVEAVSNNNMCLFENANDTLENAFVNPPAKTRPGVFWQWNGGMISKEGLTKDLEAMSEQGIGGVMVMQMPDQAPYPQRWDFYDYPGKVKVLSDEWFALVNHAIGEADRLGITFSMFICPGWSHAGGPWITPRRGLKKLVYSTTEVNGPLKFNEQIPRAPRSIGRGGGNEVPDWLTQNDLHILHEIPEFYQDIAVLAIPSSDDRIISAADIVYLTDRMDSTGNLTYNVPNGSWTIMRLGVASENGVNHPAPFEATGLEADRMDPEAVRIVFDGMIGRILREARSKGYNSFKAFETDSYEGGFQDFGLDFQEEFVKRRGYDCVPWLPSWLDKELVIDSKELTQRFRYDMTRTISELIAERFHGKLRSLADENNVEWMIEPYFMLPVDWRMMGAKSTLPGSEFWMGKPFYLIGPAPDIAALHGLQVVWAESFTAESYTSAWRNSPQVLKPWGDAVFSRGINHVYMHGFAHNPFGDHLRPGFTMGYWGTQFNRHLTWWPLASSWHQYLTRCQYMLQQGRPVNDVLAYPAKTQPIASNAVESGPFRQVVLDDEALFNRLWVRDDGRIAVKGGGNFAAITLTPGLALRPDALRKIKDYVLEGATLIGEAPPSISSSLENYPNSDHEIARLIGEIWGTGVQGEFNERTLGKGRIYATTRLAEVLNQITGGPDVCFLDIKGKNTIDFTRTEDFDQWGSQHSITPIETPDVQVNAIANKAFLTMDFTHRREGNTDIYFVCNTGKEALDLICDFRVEGRLPELWNPVSGKIGAVSSWKQQDGRTKVSMQFAPGQSWFVIFREKTTKEISGNLAAKAPRKRTVKELTGPWGVHFDPAWGGPGHVVFDRLQDWTENSDNGIKYYSGTAAYQKHFDLSELPKSVAFIELGEVDDLARVVLNGHDLGVVWSAPWQVEVPADVLKKSGNVLQIEVANTWVNRLIGDEQEPEDCKLIEWNPTEGRHVNRKGSYDISVGSRGLVDLPDWVIEGKERPSKGRYTFVTWRFYDKTAPLRTSGLKGPVKITTTSKN
jgi:hypothetical protein